jgi:hypothetical protein
MDAVKRILIAQNVIGRKEDSGCCTIALYLDADKFWAQRNVRYGVIQTFLNPIIITAHLRAARSNANSDYSCCR